MKLKLKKNKVIDGDIKSPEMEIATFSDELCEDVKKNIISTANHGSYMLKIYALYRNNMHICDVVEMLEKMEKVYKKYDNDVYLAKVPF
jgi:hypothetical protein